MVVEVLSRNFLKAHTDIGTVATAGVAGLMQTGANLMWAKDELSALTEETGQNQRSTAV